MQRSYYELKDAEGTARTLELLLKYLRRPRTPGTGLPAVPRADQARSRTLVALIYRLAESVGARLRKPSQYVDIDTGAGGRRLFDRRPARARERSRQRRVFRRGQSRAQRTLDYGQASRGRAAQGTRRCPTRPSLPQDGNAAYEVGKLYFSNADYARRPLRSRRRSAAGGVSDADDATQNWAWRCQQGKKAEAARHRRDQGIRKFRGDWPCSGR